MNERNESWSRTKKTSDLDLSLLTETLSQTLPGYGWFHGVDVNQTSDGWVVVTKWKSDAPICEFEDCDGSLKTVEVYDLMSEERCDQMRRFLANSESVE